MTVLDGTALSELLNTLEPVHPVTLEDVAAVHAAIGPQPGFAVEVFHRIRELVVYVWRDAELVYSRTLTVCGAPPMIRFPTKVKP